MSFLTRSKKTADKVAADKAAQDKAAEDRAAAARGRALEALHQQVGAENVGGYLETQSEGDDVVTHYFAATMAGYRGWRWSVVAVEIADGESSINEVALTPTTDSIVAPEWVPWRERLVPGDLSPGDLLPADEDDPRLVPGYLEGEDFNDPAAAKALAQEVGLGRARVLSIEGRDRAAGRWYEGDQGPSVPLAQSAPGKCGTCGFLVRLSGPMSTMFGVCANEFANDDARVVSFDHGCGAHSGAQLKRRHLPTPLPEHSHDTLEEELEDF